MNQLKMINPVKADQIQKMINNGGNPMGLLQQITSSYDNKTREAFYMQAKQMGFSDNLLNQVQNNINVN